jgi:hypothetical protein
MIDFTKLTPEQIDIACEMVSIDANSPLHALGQHGRFSHSRDAWAEWIWPRMNIKQKAYHNGELMQVMRSHLIHGKRCAIDPQDWDWPWQAKPIHHLEAYLTARGLMDKFINEIGG